MNSIFIIFSKCSSYLIIMWIFIKSRRSFSIWQQAFSFWPHPCICSLRFKTSEFSRTKISTKLTLQLGYFFSWNHWILLCFHCNDFFCRFWVLSILYYTLEVPSLQNVLTTPYEYNLTSNRVPKCTYLNSIRETFCKYYLTDVITF